MGWVAREDSRRPLNFLSIIVTITEIQVLHGIHSNNRSESPNWPLWVLGAERTRMELDHGGRRYRLPPQQTLTPDMPCMEDEDERYVSDLEQTGNPGQQRRMLGRLQPEAKLRNQHRR